MKTLLPNKIEAVEQAKQLLTDLHSNGEAYHPEDNALDCLENITDQEGEQLNRLMNEIYLLSGNEDYNNMSFDPCDFLLWLMMPYILYATKEKDYEITDTGELYTLRANGYLYKKCGLLSYLKQPFEFN